MDEILTNQKKYFFLRDDDVTDADASFLKIFWLCARLNIPVIYGVIPKKMTRRLTAFLRSPAVKKVPFDIVQHGWAHKNLGSGSLRYEFGPERTSADQQRDMRQGLRKLRKNFKKRFVPAFVPPFHGYDAHTTQVADALGFRIFSAGAGMRAPFPDGLLSLPAHVSVNSYSLTYRCLPLRLPSLIGNTLAQLQERAVLGIYFHHNTLKDRSDFQVFHSYLKFLQFLIQNKICRPLLFSDILKQRRYLKALAASNAPREKPAFR